MKLKTILEAYRSGERGLPTYAELVEIDAALRAQADAGPVAWRVTGHWKDGGEAGPFFYTEERLADMHLEHLASGVSVPLYILPAPEAAQALREAISICQQEGDEWDSDNVQLTKNYAHACRDRIAQLLTRASAATEPQGLSERVEELRKALFESRDAMRVMSNWVKKTDPAGHRWAVHMVDMANNVLAGAATVAEPSEQRLYTLDQMREYVEACYQARTRLMRTDPTNSVLANLVNAVRWWGAQEDGIPSEVAPAFNAAHLALGWSLSHPMDFDAANKQAAEQHNAHEWDAAGERCLKCGDKDWFASSTCSGKAAQQQAERQARVDAIYTSEHCEEVERHMQQAECDARSARIACGLEPMGGFLPPQDAPVTTQQAAPAVNENELLAQAYEECVGDGPYPTFAQLARLGRGSFTQCALRAIRRAAQSGQQVGDAEVQRVLNRLNSSDPDFDDCAAAAALIVRMATEMKGPDGYATWKDAAVAERRLRVASQSGQRAGVAEGWKLMPIEPTAEMLRMLGFPEGAGAAFYRNMLAAAPTPAAQGGDSHD